MASTGPGALSPFQEQLKRHMQARFGGVSEPGVGYFLDHRRVREAEPVEQIAWAFRASETVSRDHDPSEGLGRAEPGRAPRLTHCITPRRFRQRDLQSLDVVMTMTDELLAWGYETGIGREAEGLAEAPSFPFDDDFDLQLAWETVVGFCQQPNPWLEDVLDAESGLLDHFQTLAIDNVREHAKYFGLRPRGELNETGVLLFNAGLLMRLAQHHDGPDLHAAIPADRMRLVRERWARPGPPGGFTAST